MKGDVERHLDPAFPPLDCLVDMDLISLLRHVSIEGLGASHIDPLAIQNLGVVASEVRIPPPKFLDLHSLGFPHDGVVRHRPDLYVSAVICLSDSSVGDIRYAACQSVPRIPMFERGALNHNFSPCLIASADVFGTHAVYLHIRHEDADPRV